MLSWPAIRKFFTPGAFLEGDLILKDQYCCQPEASRIPRKSYPRIMQERAMLTCIVWTAPAAHVLHIEIDCSTDSDAAVIDIAQQLRSDITFWTRQLLFESDPAQSLEPRDGPRYVLLMEVDTRHTAETLASSLNTDSLRKLSGERLASALVRIFSLDGSATYHDMTPQDADVLAIDNRTHSQVVGKEDKASESSYFGLSPSAYVHH